MPYNNAVHTMQKSQLPSLCVFLPLVIQKARSGSKVRGRREGGRESTKRHTWNPAISSVASKYARRVQPFLILKAWSVRGELARPRKAEWKRFSSTLKIERAELIERSGCLFNPISTMTERYEFPDLCTRVVINRANITEVKKSGEPCKNNHRLTTAVQRPCTAQGSYVTSSWMSVLANLDLIMSLKLPQTVLTCLNRENHLCLKVHGWERKRALSHLWGFWSIESC